MKTYPGMKIFAFFALVLVVGFAVYAGAQSQTSSTRKQSQYLVKFGWSDTGEVDCSNRSLEDIHKWFKDHPRNTADNQAKKRYKARQYNGEGVTPGPDQGDLDDICLPGSSSAATSSGTEPIPGGTPKGNKTQTGGFAMFNDPKSAGEFATWVNSSKTSAASPKTKETKK